MKQILWLSGLAWIFLLLDQEKGRMMRVGGSMWPKNFFYGLAKCGGLTNIAETDIRRNFIFFWLFLLLLLLLCFYLMHTHISVKCFISFIIWE